MEEKNIRTYALMMQELGLTGLEIEENGVRMRLERGVQSLHETLSVPAVQEAAPVKAQPKEAAPKDDSIVEVCSPMVGMFYCAPSENSEPFVRVGSQVKKGDVLCIIEAMKLMNEIEAEQDGEVIEVCVGNNQIVDYGHVLFRMRRN